MKGIYYKKGIIQRENIWLININESITGKNKSMKQIITDIKGELTIIQSYNRRL